MSNKPKKAKVTEEKAAAEEVLPKITGVLPSDIEDKFEFYNFGHAFEILTQACTTEWNDLMGKLLYRLKARRNGGCPILAVGIKKPCIKEA